MRKATFTSCTFSVQYNFGTNSPKKALKLLPPVALLEPGMCGLLYWGSGECVDDNSGVVLAPSLASRADWRGGLFAIRCLAPPDSL